MTATDVDVVLDERTRAEVAPPCDAQDAVGKYGWRDCGQPADWIVRTACGCPSTAAALVCDGHLAAGLLGDVACPYCRRTEHVLSSERLR